MASPTKLSIDVLLINHESGKPYIELPKEFNTEESKAKITDALDFARVNLEAKTTEPFEGIEYQTTKAGDVAILWIEIEDADASILADGQKWLDGVGLAWVIAQAAGWVKNKNSNRKGYTGYSISKK